NQKDVVSGILGKGWSQLEPEYVWSDGPVAGINLPADSKRAGPVYLDLGSFIPGKSITQHVDVVVNGKLAGGWDFDSLEMRRQVRVDLGTDPGAAQHIELRIAHPVAPREYLDSP